MPSHSYLLDLTLFGVLTCLMMLKTGNIWNNEWWFYLFCLELFKEVIFASQLAVHKLDMPLYKLVSQDLNGLSGDFGVEGSVISLFVQKWNDNGLSMTYYKHKENAASLNKRLLTIHSLTVFIL